MSNIPTPHINAPEGAFARTVLMPGDPLRAKFIAENFLEDAQLVNNVRGVHGYTGQYKGKRVSVMASGMGMPSIGIYSYELFNFYGVDNIIRIGSAGAMTDKLKLRDVVAAMSTYTDSNYGAQFELPGTFAPIADFGMLRDAAAACERFGYRYKVGNVLSSDVFYRENPRTERWISMGVLAVEMEVAALYFNAARSGNRALGILTISDHLLTGEITTSEERQKTFTQMMDVALSLV